MPTFLTIAATVNTAGFTAAVTAPTAGIDVAAPILSTGMVGVFLLMLLLRVKVMPTYVHEDAKAEWERERLALQADVAELKTGLAEANSVYTNQVIPTLTRVYDTERELVELRKAEQMTRTLARGSNA